jgi:hypothetical protein
VVLGVVHLGDGYGDGYGSITISFFLLIRAGSGVDAGVGSGPVSNSILSVQ